MLGFLESAAPDEIDTDLINAGAYVLEAAVLDLIEEALRSRSSERRSPRSSATACSRCPRAVLVHVGTPESYIAAHHDLLAGHIRSHLIGVVSDGRWVDDGALISPGAVLEAPCQVAAGAAVAEGATVGAGSSVAADAQIDAHAQLRGAVVQERAPWARVRSSRTRSSGRAPHRRRRADRICRGHRAGRVDPRGRDRGRGREGVPGRRARHGRGRAMTRYEEMFGLVGRLGAQLHDGYAAGTAALGRARAEAPSTATVSALGGSAIGGSLAEALWRASARCPIAVNRAATLPGWCGRGDLVVPVSYSGSTGETLAAARAAIERGADVIAVTAGEPLATLVADAGGMVVRVPAGLPPRAALGTLFGAVAAVLEHAGAVPPVSGDIRAAAHACDAVAADRGGSLASALGEALAGTTTWIYGHGPLSAVARRFKCQLNENAKSMAVFGELPEADHNEIVGWAGAARSGGRHAAIYLADPEDPPRSGRPSPRRRT